MRKIALFAIALLAVVAAGAPAVSALSNTSFAKEKLGITVAQATEKKPELKVNRTEKAEVATADVQTPAPVMVTVVSGDSLSSIAAAHETTWVRIFNANESIANPDIINPGQELRIPRADEQLADRPLPQAAPAPAPAAAPVAAATSYRAPAPQASYPVDANAAKAYIYARESGNNPNATNPTGCYGIGQDCNGVVRNMCGADYACQDQYFTNYMASRYGSWENALAFWQANHWW